MSEGSELPSVNADLKVRDEQFLPPTNMDSEASGQDGSNQSDLLTAKRSRSAYVGHVTRIIHCLNVAIMGNKNKEEINEISAKLAIAHERFIESHELLIKILEKTSDQDVLAQADFYRDQIESDINMAYKKYNEYVDSIWPKAAEAKVVGEKLRETQEKIDELLSEKEKLKGLQEKLNPNADEFVSRVNVDKHTGPLSFRDEQDMPSEMSTLIKMLQLPKTELMDFDGDPLKFWSFMRCFDTVVGQTSVDARIKLTSLIQCCKGRAAKAIAACNLMDPEVGYIRALDILQERFGNCLHLKDAWLKQVTDGPCLKNNDNIALRDLADDVRNCCETLNAMKQTDNDTHEKAMLIVKRLPLYLQNQYRKEAMSYTNKFFKYPGIEFLAGFLDQAALQANDPLFAILDEKTDSRSSSKKFSTHNKASFSTQVNKTLHESNACILCKDLHHLFDCSTFRSYQPKDRLAFVRKHRICFNCLKTNEHRVHNCPQQSNCVVHNCKLWHHSLLHESLNDVPDKFPTSYASSPSKLEYGKVCLPVVKLKVIGKEKQVNSLALLDPGSDSTFCSKSLLRKLNLEGDKILTRIDTINPGKETSVELTTLEISAGNKGKCFLLSNVYAVDKIPGIHDSVATRSDTIKWDHLSDLPIPDRVREEVNLVIGLDHPHLLKPYEIRTGKGCEPYAVRYALGWAIHGPVNKANCGNVKKFPVCNLIQSEEVIHSNEFLSKQVERFWAVDGAEDLNTELKCMSVDDKRVLKLWKESVKKCNGHYQLPIPFKSNPPEMCNNKCMVEKRQESLKRRLKKDFKLCRKYNDEIQTLLSNNYAERVPANEVEAFPGLTWYLPIFNVRNIYKPEKFRLVFDCSALYKGESLNSQVLQGPDLANRLFGVLIRFRKGNFAIMADIKSMFYQVQVTPEHRNALRFLWWPDGDLDKPAMEYRMTVHLFGGVWSPCAATYALRHCAKVQQTVNNTDLVDAVNNDFYVDDLLHSEDSSKDLNKFKTHITKFLGDGGFQLTKWASNCQDIIESVSEEENINNHYLLDHNNEIEKVLGIQWNTKKDMMGIRVLKKEGPFTKRGLLSILASVYDPLGMVSPVIVMAKLLFQSECRLGKSWDEKLSERNLFLWKKWLDDLHYLNDLNMQRCIKPPSFDRDLEYTLHYFCDSSQNAYGVVCYLRVQNKDDNVYCTFVTSKSRLAPMKTLSIPRLELAAAVLAVEVNELVQKEINVPIVESTFWSDSMLVLQYISNHHKRFKVFVANRVAKIRRSTNADQWRYVHTDENPADDISRGLSAKKLVSRQRWLRGPEFLWLSKEQWPKTNQNVNNLPENDPEINKSPPVKSFVTKAESNKLDELLQRFSSWFTLKISVCWIRRFIVWLKDRSKPKSIKISLEEIKRAELVILKYVQKKYYSVETEVLSRGERLPKASSIYQLEPFIENGLLRVSGRLQNATFDYDMKHQVILPRQHWITKLIAREMHNIIAHGGRESTMAAIRSRYWIPRARPLVNKIIKFCVVCTRYRGKSMQQQMAALPEERLITNKPAFTYVGIDCFGPFLVTRGRGRAREKRFGCLFTCFTTRGVHIEVLNSLSSDAFINGLDRFMCRRGVPEKIYSDNGTNFVGAQRELQSEFEKIKKSNKLHNHVLSKGLNWQYNPPYASHAGGVWERIIRSARNIINVLIGKQVLDDERLSTVLCEVESILNSRPLVPLSSDPTDLEPLTPNHLLLLRPGCDVPLAMTDPCDQFGRRWRHVQLIADKFWERWTKEYLSTIQLRTKWFSVKPNISLGDLVIINDPNTHRSSWPLGRVIEAYEGKDGLTRSVKLRTASGEIVRPITKICLLEGVNCQ